ncbi:glycoside hydrolase family 108 protein [Microvirga pakistanensis]|uniref:glycoside hydrolase family 108 protein n=1 Tax=Microvirga pakistanensis TaxID=1682650 RepID=UPI00106975CE|nr:glycosyl hydrolase 108 family protein [Microvirga pakistanensis]
MPAANAPASFAKALAFVLRHEGGFSDHPRDPGGATNYGITRETLSRARGQPVSVDDVRHLDIDEASAIYRRFYWDAVRADELPPGLDLALFDLAVNSGPGRAVRLLQQVLGIEADGLIGPITLEAVRNTDPVEAIRRLTRARLDFLSRLVTWPVFGRGWRRRVLDAEQEALRLASSCLSPQGMSDMLDTKTILASRTIWANLIGLAALILGLFGFDASELNGNPFQEAFVQFVASASFVASTVFRILATRRIAG